MGGGRRSGVTPATGEGGEGGVCQRDGESDSLVGSRGEGGGGDGGTRGGRAFEIGRSRDCRRARARPDPDLIAGEREK